MPYKCSKCGHVQQYDEACINCRISANQMEQIRQAQELNYQLNMAFYADGGCCGCTEERRQKSFYALGGIFLVLGIFFLIFGGSSQREEYGLPFCFLGGIWFVTGYCCPNGCCGEYKQKREPQQNLLG